MRRRTVLVLALGLLALAATVPSGASAAFGFRPGPVGFSVVAREENGSLDHQAGSHPFRLTTTTDLEASPSSPGEPGVPFSEGDLRNLRLDFPAGLIENPSAVPQCTVAQFQTPRQSPFEEPSLSGESCQEASQIGTATVRTSYGGGGERTFGVFNLVPPPGAPAEIGFSPFGSPIVFIPEISQAEGDYQISDVASSISQHVNISGLKLTLWGTPWAVAHNYQRGNCLNEAEPESPWANTCAVGSQLAEPRLAYLTLPSACHRPFTFGASIESWQAPGAVVRRTFTNFNQGESQTLEGCGSIHFEPTTRALVANPRASSPSGFEFDLDVDSGGLLSPKRFNPAAVRTAVVTLPEGMTINPSVGAGLLGCSPSQYAAETASSPPGAGCPNGSKIGDFTVQSPLFPETVEGSLFLATPFENPFATLVSIYLVAKAPNRGVLVKVAGKLDADPVTGSLTATFDDLPQLPYTDLKVHFREGQRSPLATPSSCGAFQTAVALAPWSGTAAEIHTALSTPITSGTEGLACPSGLPPFQPQTQAGSINSQAGAYTPFDIDLTRNDTEQEITSYSTVLPPGLTGDIAGIPYCSDAAIEAARYAGGFEEEAHPSCPESTEIGRTVSGYGVGPALDFAPGGLYLAGPFHGSTFSIVAIDSAVVGPFDLGTVVVRSAIDVNPQTARVSLDSAGSDPIPHIIDGIPIHLRDIRIYISRSHLTVNPTSCEPSSVLSTLTGSGAAVGRPDLRTTATVSSRYQAFGCGSLPFAPRLKLRLRGGTARGDFPALRAELKPRSGDANIDSAKVTLPASEFLEQAHIKTICTRPQFAEEKCPAASVYGTAQAFSPLLAQPLEGPVYLRSAPERPLPDLVADLHGGGLGLRIEVVGHIDSVHGGLRGTFEGIPDAPVSRFVLNLKGGKQGLLVNSQDTCAAPQRADARFIGHSNAGIRLRPKMEVNCKKSNHKKGRPAMKRIIPLAAFVILSLLFGSLAEAEVVQKGVICVAFEGALTPKSLPRTGEAPVHVSVGAKITALQEADPPRLKKISIAINSAGHFSPDVVPICTVRDIQPSTTKNALKACGSSLVGTGTFAAKILLPQQAAFPAGGKLYAFNGVYEGHPAILAHVYGTEPVPTSFTLPFVITNRKGELGTVLTASLSGVTGRAGYITGLSLDLGATKGHESYLSASCPAPKGFGGATFAFAKANFDFGHADLTSTLTRNCKVRG